MTYYYDRMRHLVCVPYSVENLHVMAAKIGIKRHWYHGGHRPHYDIPKTMMGNIDQYATQITPKSLLRIILTSGSVDTKYPIWNGGRVWLIAADLKSVTP